MMKAQHFRVCLLAALALVLGACAAPPTKPVSTTSLWRDDAFVPMTVATPGEILAVSDAMRQYLQVDIAVAVRRQGALDGLTESLQRNAGLRLDYDAARTRTAAEAFAAQRGNCLSLTLMTAALARELGLRVSFRKVLTEESWDRRDGMLVSSGHVNIAIEQGLSGSMDPKTGSRKGWVIDFLPAAEIAGYRVVELDEATVLAMFMNNRAVESLALGQTDAAYAWTRQSIATMPRLFEAHNTLGVIYLRRGMHDSAEQVFREVLEHEADNVTALANLVDTLSRAGRVGEAAQFQARLQRIETLAPFHYFDLGLAALKRGEFTEARNALLKELARNANFSQTYFALAVASANLGDTPAAQRYLQQALDNAVASKERDIYSAKLGRLKDLKKRPGA